MFLPEKSRPRDTFAPAGVIRMPWLLRAGTAVALPGRDIGTSSVFSPLWSRSDHVCCTSPMFGGAVLSVSWFIRDRGLNGNSH